MADIRYFSDADGEARELRSVTQMRNAEFAARFPGVKGRRADGYTMWVGLPDGGRVRFVGDTADYLPVTRAITYKNFPSRHQCNAKCLGGKVNGTCECQCGGKNHGAGMFTTLVTKEVEVAL